MIHSITELTVIDPLKGEDSTHSNEDIATFLFKHLDEYGDKLEDIHRAISYSQEIGGLIVLAVDSIRSQIVGAVVINNTRMQGYIPENILVYIAIHKEHRGQGLGRKLMEEAIKNCQGDIALHVEKDNPAIHLYKKLGFTNPYLEMRLKRRS